MQDAGRGEELLELLVGIIERRTREVVREYIVPNYR
jgi:hypothetical protein